MKRLAILTIALTCLAGLICIVPGTRLALAQDTWVDGNSNWNNAANWSAGIPNSSGTNVAITDGTSTVTLDISPSIGTLALASGNTLTTNLNTALTVFGATIISGGQIMLNGGGGTNTFLALANNVTLSGTGALTMNVAGGGGSTFIQQAVGGLTLTNQSTIQGAGVIGNGGLALSNSGTVNANSSGQALLLNGGGITNTGLLEGTNGGFLQISGVTVNNAGGNITANTGGSVQLFGSTSIQGGTLNNNGGAFFGTPSGFIASLDGTTQGPLTINGTYTSDFNTDTYLYGTINNHNNFQVNGGAGTNALLLMGNNVTLQGGGTVTLSTAGGGGSAVIEQAVGGLTLTNVDNTIQGAGVIGNNGLALSNSATINANSSGQALLLNGGGITNTGLLEGTNGGFLQISGVTVNNAGGNITANTGGSVQLLGSTVIQGGTLNNSGGAFFGTPGGSVAYLDGTTQGPLTINGTYTSDLNTNTYLFGTINNKNNFQLNGGAGSNSALLMGDNVTLQGGGTLTLSTASGGGSAVIEQAVGGLTFTNVDNTIQGSGIIGNNGLGFVNQAGGTINATGTPTSTLLFQGGAVTNRGLMEATGSGVLQINGDTVNNAGGNITANGAGASVQLFGSTVIQGGTLNNNGGAFFGTPGGSVAYLDGTAQGPLTINGAYTSDLNTDTYLYGTINNKNNFLLNGGNGFNSFLLMGNNVTLQGGGTVTLSTASGGGNAVIEQAVGGLTLTNVDNTIQGSGIIGNNGLALVNQAGGTINANGIPTSAIFLQGGPVTNQGLMEATGSGALLINGDTVNNTGGNITANTGGSVELFGSTVIQGGTLNNNGGAFFGTPSGSVAYLDGTTQGPLTINGTYTSDLNTDTYLFGTINNNNNFQLNGGAGTNALLLMGNNVTLQGGGTLTLSSAGGGGNAYIQQAVGGLTLTNVDNTIQGAGIIGNNGLSVTNGAAGTILANAPGQALVFNGPGALTNAGAVQVNAGSTLQVNSAFSQTGGRTQVDGLMIASLGENVSGGIVLGTGTINGDITFTGGIMKPGDVLAPGTLTINGNLIFSTGAPLFDEMISSLGNGLAIVNGQVVLDPSSLLQIDLLGGFTPFSGETFTLMTFLTETGIFANAPATGFVMDGFNWFIDYNPTSIVLVAGAPVHTNPAPEPDSLFLLAVGLLILGCLLARRKAHGAAA